jgi:hypothetical protein
MEDEEEEEDEDEEEQEDEEDLRVEAEPVALLFSACSSLSSVLLTFVSFVSRCFVCVQGLFGRFSIRNKLLFIIMNLVPGK